MRTLSKTGYSCQFATIDGMSFGLWAWMGPRNHVLVRVRRRCGLISN